MHSDNFTTTQSSKKLKLCERRKIKKLRYIFIHLTPALTVKKILFKGKSPPLPTLIAPLCVFVVVGLVYAYFDSSGPIVLNKARSNSSIQ